MHNFVPENLKFSIQICSCFVLVLGRLWCLADVRRGKGENGGGGGVLFEVKSISS